MERARPSSWAGGDPVAAPPFVARSDELAALDTALAEAVSGAGSVLFVRGDAGSGKTALVREFARRSQARHETLVVAAGQCDAYIGVGDPYLPFIEVLAQLTGDVADEFGDGVISEESASRLKKLLGISGEALVELGPDLIGTFIPGAGLATRAATYVAKKAGKLEKLEELAEGHALGTERSGIEQSHVLEQYTNVLRHLAESQPLLVIIDDLHWADAASAALLFRLGRSVGDSAILIVGTYRPAEVALRHGDERHAMQKVLTEFKRYFGDKAVDLGEVDVVERRLLVDRLVDLEPNRIGREFRDALLRHTGGHALFTTELLRAMRERGDLVRDRRGDWIEGPSLHWDDLPPQVEGVIEERIGRLEEHDQETLAVASVEGERFTAEVVAAVRKLEARQLVRTLGRELERQHGLVRAEGLRRVGDDGSRLSLFGFRHNLFQRYLYGSLNEADRAYLHEDVGNALEAISEEAPDEFVAQLARHFSEAGVAEKAVHYLRRAGDLASARSANDEAVSYYTRALALVPATDQDLRWTLLSARERVLFLSGDTARQTRDLAELEDLAGLAGNMTRQIEVGIRRAQLANSTGDFHAAVRCASKAQRTGAEAGDAEREARALVEWGTALTWQGRLDEALAKLHDALGLADSHALHRIQASCLKGTGRIHLERGELDRADADYREAQGICRRLSDTAGEAQFTGNRAIVAQKQGRLQDAKRSFMEVRNAQHRMGDRRGESIGSHNLGEVGVELHDYHEAWCAYRSSLEFSMHSGDQAFAATTLCSLGGVAVKLGLLAEAARTLDHSLQIATEIGQRSDQGFAMAWLALLAEFTGDLEDANSYASDAVAIARDVEEPLLEGRALDFLARSREAAGDLAGARNAHADALGVRRRFGLLSPAIESQAGLARVAIGSGDLRSALGFVSEILPRVNAWDVESTELPIDLFVTCHRVLARHGSPQADATLRRGVEYLNRLTARIRDDDMQRAFLGAVPSNRTLLEHARARGVAV